MAKSNLKSLFCLLLVTTFHIQWSSAQQLCTGLSKTIFSVDFGSGAPLYNLNPVNGNFTTTFVLWNKPKTNDGYYSIANQIPADFVLQNRNVWQSGFDHTPGDSAGYMMLVNADASQGTFFRTTVNDVCIGTTYEFSAYLANVFQPASAFPNPVNSIPPSLRFEIRSLQGDLLFSLETGEIPTRDTLTWGQYRLTFKAPTSSLQLSMVSIAKSGTGNDLALDDITLRRCLSSAADTLCDFSTDLEQGFAASSLLVYPNPAKDKVVFTGFSCQKGDQLYLYNAMGVLMAERVLEGSHTEMDTKHLSSGMYVYHVTRAGHLLAKGKIQVEN